jgi:hypothetical protein
MKTGTVKQKKALQFYQELVKTGQSPLPYREPQPEAPRKPLNVALLLHFPGADDRWAWRWEGEDYESWEHRLRLGYLDWYRYIESVKNSKSKIMKAKVSFYVSLMREERYPEPIEDWRCVKKLGGLREQQEWREKTKAEIPSLIPTWRARMMQTLENSSIPIPSGLQEWQRKWWQQCWEEYYRPFNEEDRSTLRGLKGMRSAQKELELLRKGEEEIHRLNSISLDELQRENATFAEHGSELLRETAFRRSHFREEGCSERRIADMQTDRKSRRDKLIFRVQIPGVNWSYPS